MNHLTTAKVALHAFIWAAVTAGRLFAAPINAVSYASLTGTALIDFEDLPHAAAPGTHYAGLLESGGAAFGEKFAGQTVPLTDPDTLVGAPTGPLTLLPSTPWFSWCIDQSGRDPQRRE